MTGRKDLQSTSKPEPYLGHWDESRASPEGGEAASGFQAARARTGLEHGTFEPVASMLKGSLKRESRESQGPDAAHRDGPVRSSDEARVMGAEPRDRIVEPLVEGQRRKAEEPMASGKSYVISKRAVFESWQHVKANKGSAGVDEESVKDFEGKLQDNLYRIWNRMSSGSYMPPAVKRVMIPKADGKQRPLGIPTVGDPVAQAVVKAELEPRVEPVFHADSYGYRPGRSALDAVGKCRERCWRYDWVVDVDIKGFFDNIDHTLMMHAVKRHTDCKWVLLYIERWLKAPVQEQDGTIIAREKGTPQGGVISPLLANIFLHHVFDKWMAQELPGCPFERYADDVVIHCSSLAEAQRVKAMVENRLKRCKLEAHPEKTRIVYCRDDNRPDDHQHMSFDFLSYRFKARRVRTKKGDLFIGFNPGMSEKARKKVLDVVRSWGLHRQSAMNLSDLAGLVNPSVRGWLNYYGRYHKSAMKGVFIPLNRRLMRWSQGKYKKLKGAVGKAWDWLKGVSRRQPGTFVHWPAGFAP